MAPRRILGTLVLANAEVCDENLKRTVIIIVQPPFYQGMVVHLYQTPERKESSIMLCVRDESVMNKRVKDGSQGVPHRGRRKKMPPMDNRTSWGEYRVDGIGAHYSTIKHVRGSFKHCREEGLTSAFPAAGKLPLKRNVESFPACELIF